MEQLFQEKYRTDSTRLKNWDYSQDGFYLVTLCVQNREEIFGKIKNGQMFLNEIGKIVAAEWRRTAEIRLNVRPDKFVVMPNHLHGIIVIDNSDGEGKNNFGNKIGVETHCGGGRDVTFGRDVARNVSTSTKRFSEISPKPNSLSAIIRSFKSAATKRIHEIDPALDRVWQSRFYDCIIRDKDELNRVRDYICLNPVNWEKDEENLKLQNASKAHRSRKART